MKCYICGGKREYERADAYYIEWADKTHVERAMVCKRCLRAFRFFMMQPRKNLEFRIYENDISYLRDNNGIPKKGKAEKVS